MEGSLCRLLFGSSRTLAGWEKDEAQGLWSLLSCSRLVFCLWGFVQAKREACLGLGSGGGGGGGQMRDLLLALLKLEGPKRCWKMRGVGWVELRLVRLGVYVCVCDVARR